MLPNTQTLLSLARLRLFMFTAWTMGSSLLLWVCFVCLFFALEMPIITISSTSYFSIYHGESGLTYNKLHNKEQPASLFGHGCFHTSCRPCLGSHESCQRLPCQTSSGTMPKHEMVVVTRIKRTGLWGQACSGPGLGPL